MHFVYVQWEQTGLLRFVLSVLLHKQILKGIVLSMMRVMVVWRTIEWLAK